MTQQISLPIGINTNGEPVHISQITSGNTKLQCPYCQGLLTAKKGKVMVHHFAHTNETCLISTGRDFSQLDLPIFDRFNLYIKASAWQHLQEFHTANRVTHVLVNHNPPLIKESFNPYGRGKYELTNEGKIPFGEATLEKFSEFQLAMVFERHRKLSDTVNMSYFGVSYRNTGRWITPPTKDQYPINLADLNIYRAQIRRAYGLDLYLLNIETTTGNIQKIGVSTDTERRIKEIERDLKPYFEVKKIKIDRILKNRGAAERYAHHRYKNNQIEVGQHREYFQFDKKTLSNLRRDFTRLGDFPIVDGDEKYNWAFQDYQGDDRRYTKNGLISAILENEPSFIEQAVTEIEEKERHSQLTKRGMLSAKAQGKHIGRPQDTNEAILNKYPQIVDALQSGKGVKTIAREFSLSKNTVKKVRDAIP